MHQKQKPTKEKYFPKIPSSNNFGSFQGNPYWNVSRHDGMKWDGQIPVRTIHAEALTWGLVALPFFNSFAVAFLKNWKEFTVKPFVPFLHQEYHKNCRPMIWQVFSFLEFVFGKNRRKSQVCSFLKILLH